MPYHESAAARIRSLLQARKGIAEKTMFGGIGFLLHGNMLAGLWKEFLILRIDPEHYEELLRQPYVKEFDITGRPMSGWIMVSPAGFAAEPSLQKWLDQAHAYVSALPAKSKIKKKAMSRKRGKKKS